MCCRWTGLVSGSGELLSFKSPAYRSGVTQQCLSTESSNGCDRPLYSKVLLLPVMSRSSPSTTSLPMSKDNTGLSTTLDNRRGWSASTTRTVTRPWNFNSLNTDLTESTSMEFMASTRRVEEPVAFLHLDSVRTLGPHPRSHIDRTTWALRVSCPMSKLAKRVTDTASEGAVTRHVLNVSRASRHALRQGRHLHCEGLSRTRAHILVGGQPVSGPAMSRKAFVHNDGLCHFVMSHDSDHAAPVGDHLPHRLLSLKIAKTNCFDRNVFQNRSF